jgi:hypothetical protein
MTRTRRTPLSFSRAFELKSVGRSLPAGVYELVTDEELIEGLSFPACRRVCRWLLDTSRKFSTSTEMIIVDPHELAAAHEDDLACANSSA